MKICQNLLRKIINLTNKFKGKKILIWEEMKGMKEMKISTEIKNITTKMQKGGIEVKKILIEVLEGENNI